MAFGLGKLAVLESKLDIYEDLSKEMMDKLERAVSIISENSNSDLEIIATGNANVFFEDFEIQGNNIIQVNTNSGTTISASGSNGLTQFGGTNGVQIPVGTTAERPGTAGTGQLRWNTTTNELEAYSGSSWGIAAGVPQNVSQQFVDDTNFELAGAPERT